MASAKGPGLDSPTWEDKWRDDSPAYPPCAKCGKQIGSPEDDEAAEWAEEAQDFLDTRDKELPMRMWRDHPDPKKRAAGEKQEIAFHVDCAREVGLI